MLSFTAEVFFANFAHYNQAIWPAQIVATLLGIAVIGLTIGPRNGSDRLIGAVLATAWLWTGAIYHLDHFARINFASPAFGVLFVTQGLVVGWNCVVRDKLDCRVHANIAGWGGLVFLVVALALAPFLSWATGHGSWTSARIFGVTPLPTTLFTIGVLIISARRAPLYLSVVPVVWSFIDGAMAWQLGITETLLLPLGAVTGLVIILQSRRRSR